MNITHITARESHEDGIVAYSMTVYYEGMAKVRYEFVSESEDEIVAQAESLLPEAVTDYLEYIVDTRRENDTIITEYSESLKEKQLEIDMGITKETQP